MKAYTHDIIDGQWGFKVLSHASSIFIYLSTKGLWLAVPKQELEEIDVTNDISS